jgi:hypothetical protein
VQCQAGRLTVGAARPVIGDSQRNLGERMPRVRPLTGRGKTLCALVIAGALMIVGLSLATALALHVFRHRSSQLSRDPSFIYGYRMFLPYAVIASGDDDAEKKCRRAVATRPQPPIPDFSPSRAVQGCVAEWIAYTE